MNYTNEDIINQLKTFYYNQLTRDTLPFWFPRSFNREHGGFLLIATCQGLTKNPSLSGR